MAKIIYGGDTETLHGKPMTMQFYSEDVNCDEIIWVDEKSSAKSFLRWCAKRERNCAHVVYVHYLSFDLIEFLWGHHAKLVSPDGSFSFRIGCWQVSGVYGTPTFCKLSDGHGRTVTVVDSFSFFRGSLAAAAELFCPDLPKLRRVADIGEKQFKRTDKAFAAYARRDSVITYHIGKSIEALHTEFDLQQCVSVADMAARIFRHRFLDYTIPQPNRECMEMSLLSYHGGKNNVAVGAGWYEGVHSLDISSAYPDAMSRLPAFAKRNLYKRIKFSRVREVPPHGVYRVRGSVAACKWPVLFAHNFSPLRGKVDGVCVQGTELNEAISSGEFQCAKAEGYFYDHERDAQKSALRNFVTDFYRRKEIEKDPIKRFMWKLILNSISGKFIQTRKSGRVAYHDVDANETTSAADLIAGGMFHPFIASAITADTRARIHQLEHRCKALHTATDGIFTQSPGRVLASGSKQKGLGAIRDEGSGTLLLLRNKLYVLYGRGGKTASAFPGKRILKYALHGFQGSVGTLERLIGSGRRTYTISRANRLKESLKRGLVPNAFVKKQLTLKVGPIAVHEKRVL